MLVTYTDWDLDRVGPDSCCGSLSFCGATNRYPDRRLMGYPFDRRWPLAMPDVVMSQPNMAFTDIVVRWGEASEFTTD